MKGKYKYIIILCLILLFPLIPLLTDSAVLNDYVLTPPFITTVVPPNILLVLDESGSMQFPAYLGCSFNSYSSSRALCQSSDSSSNPEYNYDYDYSTMADELIRDYYGYFDPEKYYEYDSINNKFIESASPGCSFVEGAVGYKIGDNSGSCISGNILNWAAMSRVDLLRKALMGGKSVADLGGGVHTLRGEGGHRTFEDQNLNCTFDLSGGTYPALDHVLSISTSGGAVCTPDAVYSDDFNDTTVDAKWTALDIGDASGGSQWESGGNLYVRANGSRIWGTSDDFRYVYQSASGDFDIRLRIMNAPDISSSSKATLMVRETTADNSKHVMISMRGSESQLQFAYRGTTGGDTYYAASNRTRYSPEWVRLVRTGNTFRSYYSDGGTIWTYRSGSEVSVTMTDPVLIGMAVSAYSSSYGNGVFDEFVYCAAVAGGCAVGSITNASIRVDTDDRTGVVQSVADKDNDGLYDDGSPRFGVEVFASNSRYGCIRVGLNYPDNPNDSLANVINAIELEVPYSGTPTNYALEEAWDYFAQEDLPGHGNCNNSAYIDQGTMTDPFYEEDPANPGSVVPIACKGAYVLLISDGEWNTGGEPVPVARDSHVFDIRTDADMSGNQLIDFYSFFIFGSTGSGRNAMQQIAMYGGFDDYDDDTWPHDRAGYPADSRNVVLPASPCDPANPPMDSQCNEWDENGDGIPDQYFEASSGKELEDKLNEAIAAILQKASSGTASSVLASGEGSGANILQGVFYPVKRLYNNEIEWTGAIQNLWFYVDPRLRSSSIREDTVADSKLHLIEDYVARFHFDDNDKKTKTELYEDQFGDYSQLNLINDVEFEKMGNLWEAGLMLWKRDLVFDPRTIKTTIDESSFIDFSTTNAVTLAPYLQAVDTAESEAFIRYVHGEDTKCSGTTTIACESDAECPSGETCGGFSPAIAGFSDIFRKRTAAIDLDEDGTLDPGEEPKTWKLGDVISSTPKVLSPIKLNSYDEKFPGGYEDSTYTTFIDSYEYENRGLVFAGANDGMLHVFNLGKMQFEWSGQDKALEPARMINQYTGSPCDPSDTIPCGKELWSFIPKHVLPYLKYNADISYEHIYNVDGTVYMFDASINVPTGCIEPLYEDCTRKTTVDSSNNLDLDQTSWRTIVIGSMRLGGASRKTGGSCVSGTNCVKTPLLDPDASGKGLGYSSYFAIDVTDPDPANWDLLWEFSDADIDDTVLATGGLGYSTTGPAVIRINSLSSGVPDETTNGKWYVVVASGPTGPIDTSVKQFMGRSNQDLKLFVLDLKTGNLVETIDTGISNTFAGSLIDSTLDPDRDYSDDAFYMGYTYSTTGTGDTWTNGGVIRVLTGEDLDPANWEWSKVIENIGTVNAAVANLYDTKTNTVWLYFATGRYYYKLPNIVDDADSQRNLFGIKAPCFIVIDNDFELVCNTTLSKSADLVNVTDIANVPANPDDSAFKGWYIDLEATGVPDPLFKAERVITDPLASIQGAVFFTTFKPSSELCAFGGESYLWNVAYKSGGTGPTIKGKALVQVSTGSIEEIDLAEGFKENTPGDPDYNPDMPDNLDSKGDRRTASFKGVPPTGQGINLVTSPPPIARAIHIRER